MSKKNIEANKKEVNNNEHIVDIAKQKKMKKAAEIILDNSKELLGYDVNEILGSNPKINNEKSTYPISKKDKATVELLHHFPNWTYKLSKLESALINSEVINLSKMELLDTLRYVQKELGALEDFNEVFSPLLDTISNNDDIYIPVDKYNSKMIYLYNELRIFKEMHIVANEIIEYLDKNDENLEINFTDLYYFSEGLQTSLEMIIVKYEEQIKKLNNLN